METTDYVSYPLALALKKAGFDWPCRDFYWTSGGVFKHTDALVHKNSEHCTTMVAAPTLAVAQKWLREKWDLHIGVSPAADCSFDADGQVCEEWNYWAFDIMDVISTRKIVESWEQYDSYEDALSAGISAALELINT